MPGFLLLSICLSACWLVKKRSWKKEVFHISCFNPQRLAFKVQSLSSYGFSFQSLHFLKTPSCLSCALRVLTRCNRTLCLRATAERWMLVLGDAKHKDRHYCYLTPIEPFVIATEVIIVTLHRLVRS